MFKCLALLSVIALCNAADYYQMSIDHDSPKANYMPQFKIAEELKQYITPVSDLKASEDSQSDKYQSEHKNEGVDRRGYTVPSGYESYLKNSQNDEYKSESYSSPYGYERPTYEKKRYEAPSYGRSYEAPTYVEKSYSSPITAMRNVELKPIQSEGYGQKDHTIDVKDETPIVIHFRTHANRIRVEQTRVPEKPKEVEHTRSEDEPHRVIHEVYKPVIQEIREIIQPFRKVVQQVQPVVEEVQTVVHKSEGRRNRGGGSDDDDDSYKSSRNSGYGRENSSRERQYRDNNGYKRSNGGSNGGSSKKYNTLKDYLPQGSVLSVKGVPAYRSQYKGPAVPQKKH